MEEDEKVESLGAMKDQKQLDMCAEGFEIGRLSKLVGSEATHLTAELEELYHKMLAKLDGLSKVVEQGSAKVLEQVRMLSKIEYLEQIENYVETRGNISFITFRDDFTF